MSRLLCPQSLFRTGLFRVAMAIAALAMPAAAQWIARFDDFLNRGRINPVKKWWWDVVNDGTGKVVKAKETSVMEAATESKRRSFLMR